MYLLLMLNSEETGYVSVGEMPIYPRDEKPKQKQKNVSLCGCL